MSRRSKRRRSEPEGAGLRVLVFGAGVLGSLYAARLHEAGSDVTLLARDGRYRDIVRHGVVLEHFQTGEQTTTEVRVVERVPAHEDFDVCVVMVQYTQLESALPVLAAASRIPAFLFMTNYVSGPESMVAALGRERVLLGHVNAGGERDGHVVTYMTAEKMTMGELDGSVTDRLKRIAAAFGQAGFPVVISRNIDSWKRHHMALVAPICNAMYLNGTSNYRLSRNRHAVRMAVRAAREAMRMLVAEGFPVEPRRLKLLLVLPEFLLIPLFRRVLGSELMDIGGARHANAARDEMRRLSSDLLEMAERSGRRVSTLRDLHHFADPDLLQS